MSTYEPRLTGTKVCTKCGRELPVICFAVHSHNKDGLQSQCRECNTDDQKRRRGHRPDRRGIGDKQINMMKVKHYFDYE